VADIVAGGPGGNKGVGSRFHRERALFRNSENSKSKTPDPFWSCLLGCILGGAGAGVGSIVWDVVNRTPICYGWTNAVCSIAAGCLQGFLLTIPGLSGWSRLGQCLSGALAQALQLGCKALLQSIFCGACSISWKCGLGKMVVGALNSIAACASGAGQSLQEAYDRLFLWVFGVTSQIVANAGCVLFEQWL